MHQVVHTALRVDSSVDKEWWSVGVNYTKEWDTGPASEEFAELARGPRLIMLSLCNFLNGGNSMEWRASDKIVWIERDYTPKPVIRR